MATNGLEVKTPKNTKIIPKVFSDAFRLSMSPRRGPVCINLPRNIFSRNGLKWRENWSNHFFSRITVQPCDHSRTICSCFSWQCIQLHFFTNVLLTITIKIYPN